MTVLDHHAPSVSVAFPARLAARVVAAMRGISRLMENRRSFERLSQMTDRELADIGICRGDLRDAWHQRVERDPTDYLNHAARTRYAMEDMARRIA